ncbi:hypothetical protein A3844_12545 [Paenibacillus helianthi]|uniref:G5 domain-containing protein n=1 Tax=Paenibacillus helianthi TaxID=1349432 RepID=A0ABX3EPQ7_9BACL|nr:MULTISPECIES: hypothetical protein [Paenibacillus]OKP82347.1 hypothetical protein A3842_09970 [Paenibacillus sp. P3E]OKP86827.1 hypothetical protein A3844_12545 [Paenibacillus helianthi]
MRINNSSPSVYYSNQRNNLSSNKDLFESTLLVQTNEKKEEEKKDKPVEKKGHLVTAKEGAYIRQYIVNSDGSKVLLSEIKQAENESTSTENNSQLLFNSKKNQNVEDGMSNNSKELVSLLNQQVGNIDHPKNN